MRKTDFLYRNLSIWKAFVTTKTYHNRDNFDFSTKTFALLDGAVKGATSYGVYISQLVRAWNNVKDLNERKHFLTMFHRDLMYIYKLKTMKGKIHYLQSMCQFYKKCYQHDMVQCSACLVINHSELTALVTSFFARRWRGWRVYEGFWGQNCLH